MVLLIYRAEEFSPNNIAKDKAILDALGQRLAMQSKEVCFVKEDDLNEEILHDAEFVFSMARRWKTLFKIEKSCVRTINNPQKVRTLVNSRELTMELLRGSAIDVPDFWAYEASEDQMFLCDPEIRKLLPGWVKGMHRRGVTKDDVKYVRTPLEADSEVVRMVTEGYSDIIVSRHIEGRVLKCYCITNGESVWVKHFFPQDEGYTKFGDEQYNSQNNEISAEVNEIKLTEISKTVASALGLQIFGFDAILSADGRISIIDVNDWPSFSRFRDEAADEISKLKYI